MYQKLIYTAWLLCLGCALMGQHIETVSLTSEVLDQEREIMIYTPIGYEQFLHKYYHVVFVFDAQNREFFDYTHALLSLMGDPSREFIVVGIKAYLDTTQQYGRNNDFLPVLNSPLAQKRYGAYAGNADNFRSFIATEVVPYIEENYRTRGYRTAVGHSLGASFLLATVTQEPELFQNYLAISPNLAYDDQRLAKAILQFDFDQLPAHSFLYMSHADEGVHYWQHWKAPQEHVQAFLRDTLDSEKVTVAIENFPQENHRTTFPPSLQAACKQYLGQVYGQQENILSSTVEEVTIEVNVPNKKDELYIAGNQTGLGNWNPGKVRLEKISDYKRAITLKLQTPAQFKFTRGNWQTEAEVADGYMQNLIILPESGKKYEFEVIGYVDRM
ncbi:MAG: alpha/beta hydrolase-fold protein [Bacteroidota bacterium]